MTESIVCDACGYVRQPLDEAPEWECPKCQKAYNKTSLTAHHSLLIEPNSYSSNNIPPLLFQRTLFFAFKAFFLIGSGLWGIAGAGYIIENFFKINSNTGPLIPQLVLAVIGVTFGMAGGWFSLILPLHFLFPNARKIFSWESKDPLFMFRYYQWYGKKLQEYGYARERGEF